MTKPHIRPNNAATIWTDGQTIFAELPFGDLTHTISVPCTVEGMAKVIKLLSSRSESSRIGEPGEPTQHHINKPLDLSKVKRKSKSTFSQDQHDNAKEVLRKMGII